MNIYNLLNLRINSNLSVPSASEIEGILNEIVSPKFENIGLSNTSYKYLWDNDFNHEGIKKMVRFSYRGTQGHFRVGTHFNFIPVLNTQNELTSKPKILHLHEDQEYFNPNNEISLWNEKFFKKTLAKFMNDNFNAIANYLNASETVESNIETAIRQLENTLLKYTIHDPNPRYVLAFLYAKIGELDKAIKTMEIYTNKAGIQNIAVFKKLEAVS